MIGSRDGGSPRRAAGVQVPAELGVVAGSTGSQRKPLTPCRCSDHREARAALQHFSKACLGLSRSMKNSCQGTEQARVDTCRRGSNRARVNGVVKSSSAHAGNVHCMPRLQWNHSVYDSFI